MYLSDFWMEKRVLITGHTGFKGFWLSIILKNLNCKIVGIGLPSQNNHDVFPYIKDFFQNKDLGIEEFIDVNDYKSVKKVFDIFKPEIVFHMAAQPLVLGGYNNPRQTIFTNAGGTCNVLEAARLEPSVKSIISVTTDKVYLVRDINLPFNEDDPLGGKDPYSASKAAADILSTCYYEAFFKDMGVGLAVVRAGNVLGGADWSPNRIIPDILLSIDEGKPLNLRFPNAVRPWQHVLDPLHGYIILAEHLYCRDEYYSGSYNLGPKNELTLTVNNLAIQFMKDFGRSVEIIHSSEKHAIETGQLLLDCSKSQKKLKFNALYDGGTAVALAADWYKRYNNGENPIDLCQAQLSDYIELFKGN